MTGSFRNSGRVGGFVTHAPRIPAFLVSSAALLLAASLLAACARAPQADPTPLSVPSTPTRPPNGHEVDEGLVLGGQGQAESVSPGAACPAGAPLRHFRLAALAVDITLNRYLDHDPQGRMYSLEEDVQRVHEEAAQNRAARAGQAEPAVSLGLQGDAIQPLILRVNQGECLRLTLRNDLPDGQAASLHLHGSSLHLAEGGAPAVAANPQAMTRPGQSVTYEWWVDQAPEGTHYFHSHGDTREQTNHGLFGAVIVEPAGSRHLDPASGRELRSGWAAVIQPPDGSGFREFAIVYHEIGDERYRILDRDDRLIPQVDPYTNAYRPAGRALNYRSEPFMNRLALQQQLLGRFDKSQAYSSYAFGDPATPIARAYLGDPVKERVIHGGSEVFHVHHVHGGSIRWRRQPGLEPSGFDSGLDKHPPLTPLASERIDSQSIGPAESYDLAHECGSGGCQLGAGDYLIHCHVAHHYLAGMWMIWRVYNTLQAEGSSLDGLPPLPVLPDRQGGMLPAVTTSELVGRTVDWLGRSFTLTAANLADWVEAQLPPRGTPRGYDASVMDWNRQGDLYLNEPETDQAWPGYQSAAPGRRPPLYFDPLTGKLAYPFLRPHLGRRPPFAPNHGPAPFLDPTAALAPPPPGASGPWSLCPDGTRLKSFTVHAINLPIRLNARSGVVDPSGAIFVLKEDEAAVRADPSRPVPLAIRANAGEDCVDLVLKSELEDSREVVFFSKVNTHIHFAQFDVQASDGVSTGYNYEQSVRPFGVEGEALAAAAPAGTDRLQLVNAGRFQAGAMVGVGMDQEATFEIGRIREVRGDTLVFAAPLQFAHAPGEIVSVEFVRYRWYPDVQFGTAYFHDHVDALHAWRHGLFGALISEPPGSSYHDPHTGQEVTSGPVADIHTLGAVSADVTGAFRELVLFLQDDNPLTAVGDSSGGSFNLRAEPLAARGGEPAQLFNSQAHGDPETPVLSVFLGDPLVLRGLVAGTNEVHTLHVDGHWFRAEPWSLTSPPVNTVHLGISERYDLAIPRAGGPAGLPGDYLYLNGRALKLSEGSWGLLRVLSPAEAAAAGLQPLPGREAVQAPETVCPPAAPRKQFEVVALEAPLAMLSGQPGRLYVLQSDREAALSGARPPEPLVLRINSGDCLVVRLTNELPSGLVSFHAGLLAHDPQTAGIAAGRSPGRFAGPGETVSYTFYAHPEIGQSVVLARDWGNALENPRLGLYAAVVVGPEGARYTDPETGADLSAAASWRADVHPPGAPAYRDFVLFLQDEDPVIGTAIMPYAQHVAGIVGLNYAGESLLARLEGSGDPSLVFSSQAHGDPATPLLEAYAGDPARLHVLVPYAEQAHVFTLEGHAWPMEPGRAGSSLLSAVQVGPLEAVTFVPLGGAGPPGDYLYGDHREPYREAGLWGVLRVYAPGDEAGGLRPLAER